MRGEKVHDVFVALGGGNHQWRVAAVVLARQHVGRHGVAAVIRPCRDGGRNGGIEDEEPHDGQMAVLRGEVQRRVARRVRVEDPFGIVFQDPLYSGLSVPVPFDSVFICSVVCDRYIKRLLACMPRRRRIETSILLAPRC